MTKTRAEEIAGRMPKPGNTKDNLREKILQNISKGCVIPVISSSFRMEQIFREVAEEDGSTMSEDLTAQWAKYIDYPMPDRSNLAQVAQYYLVEQNNDPSAWAGVFHFMKQFLWTMANTEVDDPALAAGLQNPIEEMCFSDMVEKLDYPKFADGTEDPLRLLARFPLPLPPASVRRSQFADRS